MKEGSIKEGAAYEMLEVCGCEVFYRRLGSGRPLLLLHGWGASGDCFAGIIPHLSRDFEVFAPDFPGFGRTAPPPAAWSVKDYARLIEEFILRLGLDKPLIMGHSFGGRVCFYLGAAGVPHKLVLTGAAGIRSKRGPKYYLRVYGYKTLKTLLKLPFLRRFRERALSRAAKAGSADYRAAQGVMRQVFIKTVNEDLKFLMPRLSMSTLLIWGEADTETPLAFGRQMEQLIPASGLAVIPGAGHYAFTDRPAHFLKIIDSFFAPDKIAGPEKPA